MKLGRQNSLCPLALAVLMTGCGASTVQPSSTTPEDTSDASAQKEKTPEAPKPAPKSSPSSKSNQVGLITEEMGIPAPFQGLLWNMSMGEAAALPGTEDGKLFTSPSFPDRLFYVEYDREGQSILRLWFEVTEEDVEAAMNLWPSNLVTPPTGGEQTYFLDHDSGVRARLTQGSGGSRKMYIERFTPVAELLGESGFDFLGVKSLDDLTLDGLKKTWANEAEISGSPGREEIERKLQVTEYEVQPVRVEVQFRKGQWKHVSMLFGQQGTEFGGELKNVLSKRWGRAQTVENPSDNTLSVRFKDEPHALITILNDGDVLLELLNK